MFEGALDLKGLGGITDGDAALEDGAEAFDDVGREFREVGDGLLSDLLAFAPGLAEADGGLAGLVGYGFDVEGHGAYLLWEQ